MKKELKEDDIQAYIYSNLCKSRYFKNKYIHINTGICLKHEEIAQQLKISVGASKSNLAKARMNIQKMLKENVIDVITFTSPSTVNSLIQIIGGKDELPEEIKIACIGPVTAQAAEAAGLHVDIMEGEYTVPGLIRALVSYFNKGVS